MEIRSQCSLCMLSVQTVPMEIEIDSVFKDAREVRGVANSINYAEFNCLDGKHMKCFKPVNLA